MPAQTLTLLFTDIEASTEKLARLGGAYTAMLAEHRRIVRAELSTHEGREVDTAGDGFFAVFTSPTSCVLAAAAMQRSLATTSWAGGEVLRVRMGVHTGEVDVEPEGVVGLQVHKAARISAAAHGGQVLVSAATAALVDGGLPEAVTLRSLGKHRLKDLRDPVELFQLEAPGLEREFPPIMTLDNPALRHNLPLQTTSFVGRTAELTEIADLASALRLVTLSGAGGCGKTRLAIEVAAQLVESTRDGVWFCDLAPLSDPELVASTVASVFHLHEDPVRTSLEQVTDALQDRQTVLVLDNCEHVVDAAAKLADALLHSCPGVRLLATSREPLAIDGEHVYRVPSMSVTPPPGAASSDAVALFAERAQTHRPGFLLDDATRGAVESICRHLDGIPLAIELAASRLRALSVEDIEERLSDRFRLLTGGRRTALRRHQTLRATIDWSYEALNARDRRIFELISVFTGGFDLASAEVVAKPVEPYDVLEAMSSLVDKSLLQADLLDGTIRYQCLETIRQYSAERLAEDSKRESSAKEAHARLFLEMAETAEPHVRGHAQDQWARRLRAEIDNLRAAGAHFLATEESAEALRLAIALYPFWRQLGLLREEVAFIESALALPDADEHPSLAAMACGDAVGVWGSLGILAAAEPFAERGVRLARGAGDDAALSYLLRTISWLQQRRGDLRDALATMDEALAAARRSGDPQQLAWTTPARGNLRRTLGEIDGARSDLLEAAEHLTAVGDTDSLGNVLANLGYLELEQGDLPAARRYLQRGLAVSPIPADAAIVKQNLAQVVLVEGDVAEAAELVDDALSLSLQVGDERLAAYCTLDAALCLAAAGQPVSSAELHGTGDALLARTGNSWEPFEAGLREESHLDLRAVLGDDAFERAYTTGRQRDPEEATEITRSRLATVMGGAARRATTAAPLIRSQPGVDGRAD